MRIIADDHIHYVRDYLSNLADLELISGRAMTADKVKDADVLLVRSITRVNEDLLKNSRVKFVGSVTTGTDHLDLSWLKKQGIAVFAAEGFNAPPVADYVVGVVAAMQQRYGLLASSKKAAVIGVGRVGSLVAERLALLGLSVTLCDPFRAAAEPGFHSAQLNDIQGMDLITVHVPLTYDGDHPTFQFLKDDFFEQQNKDCVFINASRGAVVDTEVLLRAAKHTHLCLDVFEHEPLVNRALLTQVSIATPHIAGYSVQSKLRGMDMLYREMIQLKLVPDAPAPLTMPEQTLTFAGENHTWAEVVLGVFNPVIMTTLMREQLLSSDHPAKIFDQLRNEFTYRHEFGFTNIAGVNVAASDLAVVQGLGMTVAHH
jgi:erythronate-4-phosphate dehydrogenase